MRDQDLTSTTTPESSEPAPAAAEPTPEDLQAAELSRAAREAVRQPADPRIDRQLARMGLAPTDDEGGAAVGGPRPGPRAVRPEELDRIEEALASTQESLARAARRVDRLTWVVTFEGLAIAIFAVLLLLR
jgi:hypothetical protein